MDVLLQQAPIHASEEDVKAAFQKTNGNVVEALVILWNVKPPQSESTTLWSSIRDAANEHRDMVQKVLKASESHQIK